MSALNVTQAEAELLVVSLNMYADVQRNASGSVPEDVANLLSKLAPTPVAEIAPVVEEIVEVEQVPAPKSKKAKVEETPAEE